MYTVYSGDDAAPVRLAAPAWFTSPRRATRGLPVRRGGRSKDIGLHPAHPCDALSGCLKTAFNYRILMPCTVKKGPVKRGAFILRNVGQVKLAYQRAPVVHCHHHNGR
jgi:hypothetical protein